MTRAKTDYNKYHDKLKWCLEHAKDQSINLDDRTKKLSDTILSKSASKSVLAVTLTSLLKKSVDSKQDIRIHQSGMIGGYSGRGLDKKVTTPFLRSEYFPFMESGSGWLTRSFEQKKEYTLEYSGSIKPRAVKEAFLNLLDLVQNGYPTDKIIVYFFQELLKRRESQKIDLIIPSNLRIDQIMDILDKHFTSEYKRSGASRLPVLAIYSAYIQMVKEIKRYKNCCLESLESHTAADSKTGAAGDIEIKNGNGSVFEAIEVKHGIAITRPMVKDAFGKFKSEQIKRYYLLTTFEDYGSSKDVIDEILKINNVHGCQVIVNGVMHTLRYYLRLLDSTDDFIKNYVELLKSDLAVLFEHKEKWNEIMEEDRS